MKRKIKRQLLNLSIGEFIAIPSIWLVIRVFSMGPGVIYALGLLSFILLQGSLYWIYRYYFIRAHRVESPLLLGILRIARIIDLLLLLAAPILIIFSRESDEEALVAWGIYLFAIIEYINYFWYRLSYGKSGFNVWLLLRTGLKKSSINRMLWSRSKKEPPPRRRS